MSDYKCDICGQFVFFGNHTCPPKWFCLHDEGNVPSVEYMQSSGKAIYDSDAKGAAIKYADTYFSSFDYPSSMDIWVMPSKYAWDAKTVAIEKFSLGVEAVPNFYETAHEKDEAKFEDED